jgi:hypothetical protein
LCCVLAYVNLSQSKVNGCTVVCGKLSCLMKDLTFLTALITCLYFLQGANQESIFSVQSEVSAGSVQNLVTSSSRVCGPRGILVLQREQVNSQQRRQ